MVLLQSNMCSKGSETWVLTLCPHAVTKFLSVEFSAFFSFLKM